MSKAGYKLLLVVILCIMRASSGAQTDTLRVMAYNVLNYGELPLCQGPNSAYHGYLKTIVEFANPDILGLEKMGSIRTSPADHAYTSEIDFQDSILKYALDPAFPGRFNYCPFTNGAHANEFSMLFYNQNKLGFLEITCSYSNDEDFNTYKLYYKDPNLTTNHDTTFLYVTVNHDISGSGAQAARGAQIAGVIAQMKTKFSHLANMINMGDFNVRSSAEPLYQTLTAPADTNFRYFDPPFYPDATYSYPADWDGDPVTFSKVLTTSTRALGNVPNSCGTNGGGKNWYDHIFLSPWIINNANYIGYIPHSFRTVGNDGNRVGKSVNDAPTNTSAPSAVIDALFQMSNKYPVMVDLRASGNTTGTSLPDPQGHTEGTPVLFNSQNKISVVNPFHEQISLHTSDDLTGKTLTVQLVDVLGRMQMNIAVPVRTSVTQIPSTLSSGVYYMRIVCDELVLFQAAVYKN